MEDYDGLIPDGYEDEMCDMSCGERLLCVFDGYLPTCIAPLPEDLCSSRFFANFCWKSTFSF